MFRLVIFCLIFVGCSSTHRVADNVRAQRNLASFSSFALPRATDRNIKKASIALIEPKGNVIFFFKLNDNIIIKQCEPYSVVQMQEDCTPINGTHAVEVPVEQFKKRLKDSLYMQNFPLVSAYERSKLNKYKEAINNQDQRFNLVQLQKEKDKILRFINFYCGTVSVKNDCAAQNMDVEEFKTLVEKIDRASPGEEFISSMNESIDKLVDNVIGKEEITNYKFSDASDSIAYQILRSYLSQNNLEMGTFLIPAGSFTVGSPKTELGRRNNENQFDVTILKAFEMGSTAVTQYQWWSIMGTNPSYFSKPKNCPETYAVRDGVGICPSLPVETVSWNQVQDFITKLNSQDLKYQYRLPSDEEWESAARGGTQTAYFFGDDRSKLDQYAWYNANSDNHTHPVAKKDNNPFGMFDIYGNVAQWTQTVRPKVIAPEKEKDIVYTTGTRGGSYQDAALDLRSAAISSKPPNYYYPTVGFRLIRSRI